MLLKFDIDSIPPNLLLGAIDSSTEKIDPGRLPESENVLEWLDRIPPVGSPKPRNLYRFAEGKDTGGSFRPLAGPKVADELIAGEVVAEPGFDMLPFLAQLTLNDAAELRELRLRLALTSRLGEIAKTGSLAMTSISSDAVFGAPNGSGMTSSNGRSALGT